MSAKLRLPAALAAASVLALSAYANAGTLKPHIFRATSFESLAKLAKEAPPPAADMNYYGGSVFSTVKVVTVMWNKNVAQQTQDQVPLLTQALVASTYIDQAKEYSTKGVQSINGHKGTKQVIKRGTYVGQYVIKPHNQSTQLEDTDVQKELKRQIADGALPPHDQNTLYMVYFPSGISIDLQGCGSCSCFGAYHFATIDTKIAKKRNIFYSVEPECNAGFSFLTFAASHEFMEATTDNVPTPGSNPDYPQAWNDSAGFEVGDKCSGSGTLTSDAGTWTVTQYYLNSLHGCSTGNYQSP